MEQPFGGCRIRQYPWNKGKLVRRYWPHAVGFRFLTGTSPDRIAFSGWQDLLKRPIGVNPRRSPVDLRPDLNLSLAITEQRVGSIHQIKPLESSVVGTEPLSQRNAPAPSPQSR